jgi:signal transduction histidine kinase
MLPDFLAENTEKIIARTRAKVAARTSPLPTAAELENGVPLFLLQLIERLRLSAVDNGALERSATLHGAELQAMGFSVSQVVHGYGDICQAVTQLADEDGAPISASEFHTFNRCLDDAIAHAVSEFMRRSEASAAYEETERLGALAHELSNRLTAASVSFAILQKGTVGIGGSTGAVLGRSLRAMRQLVNKTLVGVRLEAGLGPRHRVSVSELVAQAEVEASMGRDDGHLLTVSSLADGVEVDADPQILSAAIGNLLHNAFKFGRRGGRVWLRSTASDDRALIEVEDECGGLPPGRSEDLLGPFEQRDADRTGLGLGLSICRKGIEAMNGELGVRDLPGKGCIFSIDLPRLPSLPLPLQPSGGAAVRH